MQYISNLVNSMPVVFMEHCVNRCIFLRVQKRGATHAKPDLQIFEKPVRVPVNFLTPVGNQDKKNGGQSPPNISEIIHVGVA